MNITTKKFTDAELADMDMKDFLASSSSEEEEEVVCGGDVGKMKSVLKVVKILVFLDRPIDVIRGIMMS